MKKAGRRIRTEHLDVRASDSLLSHTRVAVVVGKQGHTIVERNRLKRRLRELVRTRVIPLVKATDIVFRASEAAYRASFAQLSQEIEQITKNLGNTAES